MQEKFGVNCGERKKFLVSTILALTLTLGRNIEPLSSSRVRRCAAVPTAAYDQSLINFFSRLLGGGGGEASHDIVAGLFASRRLNVPTLVE